MWNPNSCDAYGIQKNWKVIIYAISERGVRIPMMTCEESIRKRNPGNYVYTICDNVYNCQFNYLI